MASILLVEDDQSLQEAYRFLFTSVGHYVKSAFNGQEGLNALKYTAYDIILLDINMPIMDGLEFLGIYKNLDRKASALVVFSNIIDKNITKQAMRDGADSVVLKSSLTPSDLLQLIDARLSQAKR